MHNLRANKSKRHSKNVFSRDVAVIMVTASEDREMIYFEDSSKEDFFFFFFSKSTLQCILTTLGQRSVQRSL